MKQTSSKNVVCGCTACIGTIKWNSLFECAHIYDHGMYMYVVYIWKWSSAHALGGVSGGASFITTDEQLQ